MSQGEGVQRNRVFSRLSQISPRPKEQYWFYNDTCLYRFYRPSKRDTLTQRWANAGPASQTGQRVVSAGL